VHATPAPPEGPAARGALRVRLSRGAGLSPAARAVSLRTDNLGALVRVAAGR
jgi:hypothetical protein